MDCQYLLYTEYVEASLVDGNDTNDDDNNKYNRTTLLRK